MTSSHAPFITIVVPVRNEAQHILTTLRALLSQNYPAERMEILVADGMSIDGTEKLVEEIARSDGRVRLLENKGVRSSCGRNVGVREAKGDIIAVVDGHCHVPSESLLQDMADLMREKGVDCLSRPQPLCASSGSYLQTAISLGRKSPLGHSLRSVIFSEGEGYVSPVSAGAVYHRRVFDKVGLFDENFEACEDVEFNYRVEKAGFRTYSSPSLTVQYEARTSFAGLFRQMFRYGQGRHRFLQKHPQAFSAETLFPSFFLLGIPVVSVAAFLIPSLALVIGGGYALYAAASLLNSAYIAARNGWKFFPVIPLVVLAIHLGLGAGFLCSILASVLKDKVDREVTVVGPL